MDKIGVLGKSDVANVGTRVVHGVAPGRGARCRLFYYGVPAAGSTLMVQVGGVTVFQTSPLQDNRPQYSTDAHIRNEANSAQDVDGGAANKTVAPFGLDYWLGPNDTVEYTIGGADFHSMHFRVVGVEVDV